MTIETLPIEADLAAFIAGGHSRTRATELTIGRTVERAQDAAVVILVEGVSDAIAVEIMAGRSGRSLRDERIAVVPMGGATNIGRFVSMFGRDVRLAGLYDVGAQSHVRRHLDAETQDGREALGFFACVEDLEDELIRSLGTARVERIVEKQGQLRSFRKAQYQPHHRGKDLSDQLYRFVGRWRYRYARLLAEAVDLERLPRPVGRLLDHLTTDRGRMDA